MSNRILDSFIRALHELNMAAGGKGLGPVAELTIRFDDARDGDALLAALKREMSGIMVARSETGGALRISGADVCVMGTARVGRR